MMLAAVTGANGMIGQRVIQQLLGQGVRIRALVRKNRSDEGGVEYIIGDITSKKIFPALLEGVDTVFHCAAEIHDDSVMNEVNVIATKNLAVVAVEMGVTCFVHLSSAGVVGPTCELLINETVKCFPDNAYEQSKDKAEKALLGMNLQGMRLCILRPTNVVDVNRAGILATAFRNRWFDGVLMRVKGGEGAHLVHAVDVAAAAIYLAEPERCLSGIFFVGCDEDSRNTLGGAMEMCSVIEGKGLGEIACFPVAIPYFLRHFSRGRSLHGNSRFSSAKLISTGFKFPLGFERTISAIYKDQKDV